MERNALFHPPGCLHVGDASRVGVYNIVGEVDEQLGETPLGCGVVSEDRGECGISKRLGKALPKGFAGSGIVAEAKKATDNMLEKTSRLRLN